MYIASCIYSCIYITHAAAAARKYNACSVCMLKGPARHRFWRTQKIPFRFAHSSVLLDHMRWAADLDISLPEKVPFNHFLFVCVSPYLLYRL